MDRRYYCTGSLYLETGHPVWGSGNMTNKSNLDFQIIYLDPGNGKGVVNPELCLLSVSISGSWHTLQSQNKCYSLNYQDSCFWAPCSYLHLRLTSCIISMMISKQNNHWNEQAKRWNKNALSCIKIYAMCCMR